MENSIERLAELHQEIEGLWSELAEADEERVTKLRTLIQVKSESVEPAKKALRGLGAGTHEIGGYSFRVTPGPKKALYDIDDVLEEAEDRGHMDELLKAGFLTYSVNPIQVERLPDKLKAIYSELQQVKIGTARVSIPAELK